jgi:hypothetical protein
MNSRQVLRLASIRIYLRYGAQLRARNSQNSYVSVSSAYDRFWLGILVRIFALLRGAAMSKAKVLNPVTRTHDFGSIPLLTLNTQLRGVITTVPAPIYLVEGRHFGPNGGFGVAHIWAEHEAEIVASGFATLSDVPAYVQRILSSHALIYFEDRRIAKSRVNAVRIVTGTVILEYVRTIENKVEVPHWSVVTAYSNTRTAGVLVGSI